MLKTVLLFIFIFGILVSSENLYGVAYGIDQANCPTYDQILSDLTIIKTFTNRVRIYACWYCGNICLNMVKATQYLQMELFIGLQPLPEDVYSWEKSALNAVNSAYGFSNIIGVSVGSEGLYRGDYSSATIASKITDIKSLVTGFGANIPVGTADVYYKFDDTVIQASDIILINAFSYWEGVPVENAAQTTIDHYNSVKAIPSAANKKVIFGETGWPTGGDTFGGVAVPSDENQKIFLNTFMCKAIQLGIEVYYFSAFDNMGQSTSVENHWGLYTYNRQRKPGFVLDCSTPSFTSSPDVTSVIVQSTNVQSTSPEVTSDLVVPSTSPDVTSDVVQSTNVLSTSPDVTSDVVQSTNVLSTSPDVTSVIVQSTSKTPGSKSSPGVTSVIVQSTSNTPGSSKLASTSEVSNRNTEISATTTTVVKSSNPVHTSSSIRGTVSQSNQDLGNENSSLKLSAAIMITILAIVVL